MKIQTLLAGVLGLFYVGLAVAGTTTIDTNKLSVVSEKGSAIASNSEAWHRHHHHHHHHHHFFNSAKKAQ